jgi:uncharacterized protein (DUF1501 family)
LGAAAGWTVPAFLGEAFFGREARAQGLGLGGPGGPVVVVVQMGGGNDVLNTVVPYDTPDSAVYYAERPNLAIPPEVVLPLGGGLGLHPALPRLKALWDAGELAVVNGVGYPNPNLSHFKSFDSWHTGRPNEVSSSGWLGRFFDHACSGAGGGCPATLGVSQHAGSSLAFAGAGATGVTVGGLDRFAWSDLLPYRDALDGRNLEAFRELLAGGGSEATGGDVRAYLHRVAHSALASTALVREALDASSRPGFPHVEFPTSALGVGLRNVAAMVHSDLPAAVYYLDQSGYDTHARQVADDPQGRPLLGTHAALLADLDASLGAFAAEMRAQGNWDRVLVFTFSEFGRKVAENASLGSDHGAAMSVFATGGGVVPGFYGAYPSLARASRIKNDSLLYNTDFRRVYRTVLERWLGVPATAIGDILPGAPPGSFEPIPFL